MKLDKPLTIYSFAVCLILAVAGVLSAKNAMQVLNGIIFLPLVFFFGIKISKYPRRKRLPVRRRRPIQPIQAAVTTPEVVPGVADNNKRLFLKLIGSAGITLLLMALFTKKAQASFFGSEPTGPSIIGLKNSAGDQIDPAEQGPLDDYAITNIDDSGSPAYYGFVKKNGSWYIMRQDSNEYFYAKGSADFTGSWNKRTTLTYDYFNIVFA